MSKQNGTAAAPRADYSFYVDTPLQTQDQTDFIPRRPSRRLSPKFAVFLAILLLFIVLLATVPGSRTKRSIAIVFATWLGITYVMKRCFMDVLTSYPKVVESQQTATASEEDMSSSHISKDAISIEEERNLNGKMTKKMKQNFLMLSSAVVAALIFICIAITITSAESISDGMNPNSFVHFGNGLGLFLGMTILVLIMEDILHLLYWISYLVSRQLQKSNVCRKGSNERSLIIPYGNTIRAYISLMKGPIALLCAIGLTIAAFAEANGAPKVFYREYSMAGLPAHMDGMKIAQISDLHIGTTVGIDIMQEVVDRVMEESADLIVISGDLVDSPYETFKASIEPLKGIHAPRGVYYSTGNHEFYHEGLPEWMQLVSSYGIRPLRNERVTLFANSNLTWSNVFGTILFPETATLNGTDDLSIVNSATDLSADSPYTSISEINQTLITWKGFKGIQPVQYTAADEPTAAGIYLVGLEDISVESDTKDGVPPDLPGSLGARNGSRPVILIAHQPAQMDSVTKYGPRLVLSGHTHAGQVFPLTVGVNLVHDYVADLYQVNQESQIYVNRGTNQWGPFARLGSTREITIHTLRKAS